MSETVNDPPDYSASTVKLPPAALRLGALDFDPLGHPYYRFPPFLSPADGTPLIPFDQFEAIGIEIRFDSDGEEVDGKGIPTIELGTKHGAAGDLEKRRKKKRSKNVGNSKKGQPWWEEWGETEDLRRADCYDPNTPRTDRFAQGAYDFQQNRHWTPILQSLYDHFRHFSGLLGHATKNHQFGKNKGMDEDEDDDEAELTAEQENQMQAVNLSPEPISNVDAGYDAEPKIREIDAEYEAELEAKEMKMDTFLNDPEESLKIFFSSFYKDKGLFWSEIKLRDGPILLSFFLSFFIRNKIMPDYEKAFRKALRVIELARLELPQTTKISIAMPDPFSNACVALWGTRLPGIWDPNTATTDVNGDSFWSKPAPEPEPVKEWEAALKEKGMEVVSDVMAPGLQGLSTNWGMSLNDVETGPIVEGWGDNARVVQDDPNLWGVTNNTTDWAVQDPKPCLMSMLGPTTIPLTHNVQLIERSTRQVISISPPNPDDKGLGRVLGTALLAPWKNPKKVSTILPPELLSDLPEGSTYDMARDVIKVFVDPKAADVLRAGMGLFALFVQVVGRDTGHEEVKEKKKYKSRSKGKNKAKASDDQVWWYIEFLYEVVPSFWTEEGE